MNTDRMPLSASDHGRPIKIVATATPGTLLHTAVSSPSTSAATTIDEVWLWVANSSAGAVVLTVQWGGVTAPDDHLVSSYSIPANSAPVAIAAGLPLRNGLLIRAFAASANVLIASGYVNRLTRTFYSGKVGGAT